MKWDPARFGRRVAAAREWRDLRPKELAGVLGRSTETVNAIERGDRIGPPDKLLLGALAHALGVGEEWLLRGSEPPWMVSSAAGERAGVDLRAVELAERVAESAATLDALASELDALLSAPARPTDGARAAQDRAT